MRLPTPVAIAATPDDEDDAEPPVGDAEPLPVDVISDPDASPGASPLNLSPVVHIASKLLAFVQAGPRVLFEPDTHLTGAH